jgi:hypothetical protein
MHVEWKDLPNAIKIILIREMCQDMQFLAIVEFFQLDDSDLDQFMEMLASELALFDKEMSRLDGILQRQDDLVRAGLPDQAKKEWDEFMVQETTGNDRPQFALYSVKPEDVGRGKCFLLDFRTREEYHDFDPNTASEGDLEAMNCIPKFATVHAAVTRLDDYIGTAVHCDDPVFEKALLKDYQEAVQYIKEAEMIENALTASTESGSHGHEGQGASDNYATTPTQASDVVSNNGEADDETTPPKKKATKSTKNTKTRASTELVNKKLSPKKATPKTKNKNKGAPPSLPPSSLRNVTNSEDLNTPNQSRAPSTTPPLFSPASTWIPSIASSPIVHPRVPSRSVSPIASLGEDKRDAANTHEEVARSEQNPTELDPAYSQTTTKPVVDGVESEAAQTPIPSIEKPSGAENKSDVTKLLTAKSSASIEQALTNAVAAELLEKLRAYVDTFTDGADGIKGGHVDDLPVSSASTDKTPSQANATDLKTESAAKTEVVKEADGAAAPKVEKTENSIGSPLDLTAQETVKGVAKTDTTDHHGAQILETDTTENAVHGNVDLLKTTNEGGNEVASAKVDVPTILNDGKTQEKSTTVKENAEPELSTDKEVNDKTVNQPGTEKVSEEMTGDTGAKSSKKRTRTPLPDSPLPAAKKQRVEN